MFPSLEFSPTTIDSLRQSTTSTSSTQTQLRPNQANHPDEINPFVATILEAARIAIPYYLKNKKARHTLIDSAIRHIVE